MYSPEGVEVTDSASWVTKQRFWELIKGSELCLELQSAYLRNKWLGLVSVWSFSVDIIDKR